MMLLLPLESPPPPPPLLLLLLTTMETGRLPMLGAIQPLLLGLNIGAEGSEAVVRHPEEDIGHDEEVRPHLQEGGGRGGGRGGVLLII